MSVLTLPLEVALAIIAFLLSLLPAGLFIWLWYLRRHDRPVPLTTVALAFLVGMVLVWPAFRMEEFASIAWYHISPETAHNFIGAVLPLQSALDVVLPALGTFIIVAAVEEGLRYLVLYVWLKRSKEIDQVFDGLVVGIALGIGFATIENTLYFLDLISQGSFDTLVFVFFLRFLISTLAHISFGGIMGALVAQGVFNIFHPRRFLLLGFLIPWFLHGLYDLLLGIDQAVYAVLMLLPLLLMLVSWTGRRDFFAVARRNGHILAQPQPPTTRHMRVMSRLFQQFESPWNKYAPWLRERRVRYTLLRDLDEERYE
jgi:RsiW-degrading membrane proteinase PrsW (M82 family)